MDKNHDTSKSTSVHLKHALLADPLTNEGRNYLRDVPKNKNMPPEHFLEKHFVPAICDDCAWQSATDEPNEMHGVEDVDKNDKNDPYTNNFRNKVRTNKEDFEVSFLGKASNEFKSSEPFEGLTQSMYLIEAPAGSGKTTYANWLLHMIEDKIILDSIDFDFVNDKSVEFLNQKFTFYEVTPINSFKLELLKRIGRCFTVPYEKKDEKKIVDKIKDKVSKLVAVYRDDLRSINSSLDDPEFTDFFECLENSLKADSFGKDIHEYLLSHQNCISNIQKPDYDETKINTVTIEFLLGILCRLYFCLSKSGESNEKKYLLFIDNIEWAMNKTSHGESSKAISDEDITIILNAAANVSMKMETKINQIYSGADKKYSSSYAILFATRESTIELLAKSDPFRKKHNEEKGVTAAKIVNWFNFTSIVDAKIKAFIHEDDVDSKFFREVFDCAMKDLTFSKWSLGRLIPNAYNQNFRKAAGNVALAMSHFVDSAVFFMNNWKKADELYKQLSCNPQLKEQYQATKHLCRKVFLRIILDHINSIDEEGGTRCFEEIEGCFSSENEHCQHVRRLLFYLNNRSIYSNGISYPSTNMIVENILKRFKYTLQNDNVEGYEMKSLALLIKKLNIAANLETNWANAVNINSIDDIELEKIIPSNWRNFSKKINNRAGARIKITTAGKFYALVFQDFEYFACRHQPDSKPLYMIRTIDEFNQSIKAITGKVFDCIDETCEAEAGNKGFLWKSNKSDLVKPSWFFKLSKDFKETAYPKRIIVSHLRYFKDYLLLVNNDESIPLEERNQLKIAIEATIKSYEKKEAEIKAKYPKYYELWES